MIIHFETDSEDGSVALESVEMPCVPRQGETVTLRGALYGGMRRYTNGEGYTVFKVRDVDYDIGDSEDVTITVHLKLHFQDEQRSSFKPRCVCKVENREIDEREPTQCGNCRGLAWWTTTKS